MQKPTFSECSDAARRLSAELLRRGASPIDVATALASQGIAVVILTSDRATCSAWLRDLAAEVEAGADLDRLPATH